MEIKELGTNDFDKIKDFFVSVFTIEPWNDDWSDEHQLRAYITDLTGNPNSLTYGLYDGDEMVGLSMGCIKHWYSGTEYYIDEFCVKISRQGEEIGTQFMNLIEKNIVKKGMKDIFLQTEKDMPAYEFYEKRGFTEAIGHVSFYKNL